MRSTWLLLAVAVAEACANREHHCDPVGDWYVEVTAQTDGCVKAGSVSHDHFTLTTTMTGYLLTDALPGKTKFGGEFSADRCHLTSRTEGEVFDPVLATTEIYEVDRSYDVDNYSVTGSFETTFVPATAVRCSNAWMAQGTITPP